MATNRVRACARKITKFHERFAAEFTLRSVVNEVCVGTTAGRSLFARQLDQLGLSETVKSRLIPVPDTS